ncbi:MAG: UDP-N-acetylglucosamine 1-carboxyvinyltransferase [Parcubacteria group bacterium]|nr:UDP-N-acetylglucosamine 1-carboxyvinyltransferase [Parcubacteria group bacterium]
MSTFIINGGRALSGEWRVQGMKNAATPVLAATLLSRDPATIRNIPRISDISHMLAILEDLGARITWRDEHTATIHTPEIKKHEMDYLLTKRMRSSVLFLGPLLASLGKVRAPAPGGCNIGNRPLDAHMKGFEALGAKVSFGEDGYYTIMGDSLQASEVRLIERSVTATENVLMLASAIPGRTVIKNAASEPHVVCLCSMLSQMGAEISGAGTEEVAIQGRYGLKGVDFEIIPDQLEIGTIAVLGALCGGEVTIAPVVPSDVLAIKEKLEQAGVLVEESGDQWTVRGSLARLKAFTVETAPHPGFPTDLQAPFGLLATQARGESRIHDPMYENRLGYIGKLADMGARARVIGPHTAAITGPFPLSGGVVESLDLRAGATLLMAGLAASGRTIVKGAEIIDRGYEAIDERLRALGADIARVE